MLSEQTPTVESEDQLPGMPPSLELRLEAVGDSVVVSYGGRVLGLYERGDQGMRNLAIVSLTRAGVPGVEVAALFGIRPEHVSRLRRQAAEGGARALLPARGRPLKLDQGGVARAYEMSDRGVSGVEIAETLGVSETMISRLLARRPAREVERLALTEPDVTVLEVSDGRELAVLGVSVPEVRKAGGLLVSEVTELSDIGVGARVGDGSGRSVYAGAMLLHPFLDRRGRGRGARRAQLGSGAVL